MSSNNNAQFDWSSQPARSVASVLSLADRSDDALEGQARISSKKVTAKCVELCSKVLEKLTNFAAGAPIRAPSIVPGLKSKTTVLIKKVLEGMNLG